MSKKLRTALFTLVLTGIFLSGSIKTLATANDNNLLQFVDTSVSEPVEEIQDTVLPEFVKDYAEDGINSRVMDIIGEITNEHNQKSAYPEFNRFVWDRDTQTLVVHVTTVNDALKNKLATVLDDNDYRFVTNKFSFDELNAVAIKIIEQRAIAGVKVTSTSVNEDSSAIVVGLDVKEIPLELQLQLLKEINAEYPVEFAVESEPLAAYRMYNPNAPHIGGAYMQSSAGLACSTGFWVWRAALPANNYSILTADHCGSTGDTWNIGTTIVGNMVSTVAAGADIKRINTALPPVPAVFYGPWNSNLGVYVSGMHNPVLGQSWCINGAPSGTVCNNAVVQGPYNVSMEVSPGVVKTYTNSYRTLQVSGIPAAGQGDSGGNVFRVYDGKIYMTGIISAISNYSTECTGLGSGERLCSDEVILAGVDAFFSNNLPWMTLVPPN